MSIQVREIAEKFSSVVRLDRGSSERSVTSLKDPTQAGASDLIVVAGKEHFQNALESKSEIWLVQSQFLAQVPARVPVVLSSENAMLGLALIARELFPLNQHHQIVEGPLVSPRAVVSPTAQVGKGCKIGPGAIIGDRCVIGEDSVIGANAVLEPDVRIGRGCHIHPLVYLGHSCELGDRCEIHPHSTIGSEGFGYAHDKQGRHHRITHYGRVILGDDVHIGAGVQIDRGTFLDSQIGSQTKIDNHCHFGHNIVIGKGTIITGGMITAGSVTIGDYCVFGGRTTIAGHLKIGSQVQVGGLSGITKSLEKQGQYAGFPVQDLKADMRVRASSKQVPRLLKQMQMVLKKLGLDSDAPK